MVVNDLPVFDVENLSINDMEKLNDLPKYLCKNWSKIHHQCKLTYNGVLIDKRDLKKNCKGIAAPIECAWLRTFFYQRFKQKELDNVQ